MKTPITRGDEGDRGYKLCRCTGCGFEAVCTPKVDFYTRDDEKKGPLYCEMCLLKPADGPAHAPGFE